jgi:hypothetical protein
VTRITAVEGDANLLHSIQTKSKICVRR